MNWYKRIKISRRGTPLIHDQGGEDPYRTKKPYHGDGFELHTPGENNGFGSDYTNKHRPPGQTSELNDYSLQRDIPSDHDGGDKPAPQMVGAEGLYSSDSPLSISQQVERSLSSDNTDRRIGVHNMPRINVFEKLRGRLQGV